MMKPLFLPLLLSAIILVPYFPALSSPWSAIDDWELIKTYKEVDKAFENSFIDGTKLLFIDPQAGRSRSSYLVLNFLNFKLFGLEAPVHHGFRLFMLWISSLLVYQVSVSLTQSTTISALAMLIFGWSGFSSENWIRLGPQEVYLVLFQLISLLSLLTTLQKKDSLVSKIVLAISTVVTFFTKEIAILWLFVPVILFVISQNTRKKLFNYIIFCLALSITVVGLIAQNFIRSEKTYGSTYFSFSIEQSISNLIVYSQILIMAFWPILPIFVLGIVYLYTPKHDKLKKNMLVLGTWTGIFILVQSFWKYPLGRYLLPITPYLSILLASLLVLTLTRLKSWFLIVPAILAIILVFFQNTLVISATTRSLVNRDIGIWNSLAFLSSKVPEGSKVYSNLSIHSDQVEWWYGQNFLLHNLMGRPDISLERLPLTKSSGDKKEYILYWSAQFNSPEQEIHMIFPKVQEIYSDIRYAYYSPYRVIQLVSNPRSAILAESLFGPKYQLSWKIFTNN